MGTVAAAATATLSRMRMEGGAVQCDGGIYFAAACLIMIATVKIPDLIGHASGKGRGRVWLVTQQRLSCVTRPGDKRENDSENRKPVFT